VGELRCSGRAGSFCSTSDTHRVTLATNPAISHEMRIRSNKTYTRSCGSRYNKRTRSWQTIYTIATE